MKATRKDVAKILEKIEFITQPHEESPLINPTDKNRLDVSNTTIFDDEFLEKFRSIEDVDRMSTIANSYLIYSLTKLLDLDECYVNVGTWKGFSYFSGCLNQDATCIGVDNFSEFGGPKDEFMSVFNKLKHQNTAFYEKDYRDFFKQDIEEIEKKIGLYFYDGEHSYENQYQGLIDVVPYLSEDAIILVDDTNWIEPRSATLQFLLNFHYQYEIIFDQLTYANGHPTFWNGLMILKKNF